MTNFALLMYYRTTKSNRYKTNILAYRLIFIGIFVNINANTVQFHKKKLFEKLHAENITETMGIATNLRLI